MGGRPADVACLQPIKADPLPLSRMIRGGLARPTPPSPLHNSSAWLVMPPVSLLICASPAPFDTTPRWPRPRGPKGAHLKEETKRNRFPLHSSLIRVLGAEQSAPKDRRKFSEKGSKCRTPTFHIGRRHFGMFWTGRASTSSRASTADMPPI